MTRLREIRRRWREPHPPRHCTVITALKPCCLCTNLHCTQGDPIHCGRRMSRLRWAWSGNCGQHDGTQRQVAGDNAVQIQIGGGR